MLLKANTTVQLPRAVVWKVFTDPPGWAKWWGGSLQSVDPAWQQDGYLRWQQGPPTRIAECVPLKKVKLISTSSGLTQTFTFSDAGSGATLVTFEEDYGGSTLSVTDPGASQAQCEMTMDDFKRYAENEAKQGSSAALVRALGQSPAPVVVPAPVRSVPGPKQVQPGKPISRYWPLIAVILIVLAAALLWIVVGSHPVIGSLPTSGPGPTLTLAVTGTAVPSATSTPPPAATPRKLTGHLEWNKSGAALVGADILLCKLTGDSCEINTSLKATTHSEGSFEFQSLPPGTYVVLYNPNGIPSPTSGILDLSQLSKECVMGGFLGSSSPQKCAGNPAIFGGGTVTLQKGTRISFGASGTIEVSDGSLFSEKYNIYLDFVNAEPITVKMVGDKDMDIVVKAWDG